MFSGGFFSGGEEVRRGGYMGGSFHRRIFHGGRDFSIKRAPIFQHYLKSDQKLDKKKSFFQLKVRNNIRT